MKSIKKILLSFITFFVLSPIFLAADLTYVKDATSAKFDSVFQNNDDVIFILNDKLTMQEVYKNRGITTTGDISVVKNKAYTKKQMLDGTFESERTAEGIYSYRGIENDLPVLVYSKPILEAGEYNVEGTATFKFKEAVIDNAGNKYDLHMLIDNITIKSTRVTTKPIILLGNYDKSNSIWYKVYFALQERSASAYESTLNSGDYKDDDYVTMDLDSFTGVGVSYDSKFYVTKANTNELVNKEMILIFKDIDQPDRTNSNKYFNDDNTPSSYAEGIILKEGIIGDVHLSINSIINVSDTSFGSNTKYIGTAGTSIETIKSSIMLKVNSAGFKINWSGSNCGTQIGLLDILKVETRFIGEHTDESNYITPTDNAIIHGNDKTIEVIPGEEYSIKRVLIDGEEIDLDELEYDEETNTYTYTFESIEDNHLFECELLHKQYLIHYDSNGGTGTMDDTVAKYDETVKLSKNKFEKQDNTFTGWKVYAKKNNELILLKDGVKDLILEDEDSFTNNYEDGYTKIVLVAQWVSNPHTGRISALVIYSFLIVSLLSLFILYKRGQIIKN